MKLFLYKILKHSFFSTILCILVSIPIILNYNDEFYGRLTSPKQSSLIIGTSRAAQGLIPSVFDSVLIGIIPNIKMYNFAFTVAHSPYGKPYYNAIQNKLNISSKNGFFIVSVDPWAVSTRTDINEPNMFREDKLFINKVSDFNVNPNLEYLLTFNQPFNNIKDHVLDDKWSKLHYNGWFEISVPMDSVNVKKRTSEKIEYYYSKNLPFFIPSDYRLEYLEKTIKLLKNHGTVLITRLPVHSEILHMENSFYPNFNIIINQLANKLDIIYLDFTNNHKEYSFTDGNHLHKSSGKNVSLEIANYILTNFKEK